jgi:hypothetical protein
MATDRQPVWWVLYTVVPLMGGLLVLEHRASLSPAGHRFAQIGIVLCIYGLVWLWLRANTLALLRVAYGIDEKTYHERTFVDEANGVAQSLRSHLIPRRAYVKKAMVRHAKRHIKAHARNMEINKCSLN